ncbi:DUF7094 domain-containing protein [Halobellus sp. EA9]|uniref:DUF7094 domain-containing protein n=1 Tax=Halobellus sp. EA9 TaxID=3421647 RepID=UPI003EBDD618
MRAVPLALAFLLALSAVAGGAPVLSAADRAPAVAPSSTPRAQVASPAPEAGTATATASTGPDFAGTAQLDDADAEAAERRVINVLGIPAAASARSTLETEYVELGSGLAFTSATADARLETTTVLARIQAADTVANRQQYLLQAVSAIEQRVVSLRARQRQVVAAYSRGDLSPRRLLYELALIDAEARELEDRRARLQSLAREASGFTISASRFGNIELELNTLTGPVRGYAAAVLRGEAASSRFFVQSGPNSVVLSVIRDGTYVREAYRGPLRTGDSGSFSLVEAVNVTERAYPTVAEIRLRDDVLGNPDSDSTRVTIEHERGRLVAYVDSGSKRVFKEYQYRPLDQMTTRAPVSAEKDALNLTAHRTYPGGPVRLQLNSTTSGEPVDAQITVGPAGGRSSVVGRTGSDGSLWTMAPAGTYQVTAIDGSSVVLLSVEPTSTPFVYGAIDDSGGNGTATPTPDASA